LEYLTIADFTLLVFSNLITFFIVRINKKNSYHLFYLILHLLSLICATLMYKLLLLIGSNYYIFEMVFLIKILSVLFLFLHVSAAIKEKRPEFKMYYLFPVIGMAILQFLNANGIYVLEKETLQTAFLRFVLKEDFFYGDQAAFLTVTNLFYITLILLDFYRFNKDSRNIIRKGIFAFWLFGYCFVIQSASIIATLYYYSITDFGFIVLENKHISFFTALGFFFFLLNPGLLYYFKVFKSGKVVNLENHKTVFEQINEAVELEKLFLKKDFNFNKLMFLIGQSGDSIRAAIKINTNKTFIDFINTYRVAASVNLMENGYLDMHSLDSLGMASGFNSQQSFYRAFRKEYDLTPGEYWISKKTKK